MLGLHLMFDIRQLLFLILAIWIPNSQIVRGEYPEIYVAEGQNVSGRVLKLHDQELKRVFIRNNQKGNYATRIGSIEVLSREDFYLCSGEDSLLIHRSRIGEELFHESKNLIKQIRSDRSDQIWWSELSKEAKEDEAVLGSLWKWNSWRNQAELSHRIQRSKIEGKWNGAFDLCNGRVLIATEGEKHAIYDISDSKAYIKLLDAPIRIRSFRWDSTGKIWIVDHRGRIVIVPNAQIPNSFEVVLSSPIEFTDFDFDTPH
jgi:hypothetical protein